MRYLQHSLPKLKRYSLTRKHERTLRYLLIGVAAFNAADYMLTLLALRMGYRELNPLMWPNLPQKVDKYPVPLSTSCIWGYPGKSIAGID